MKKSDQILRSFLDDVLTQDEAFVAFERELKKKGLAAYRRKLLFRRVQRGLGLAASITLLSFLVWSLSITDTNTNPTLAKSGVSQLRESRSSDRAAEDMKATTVLAAGSTPERISDDELVAMFPPQSCFLVEVAGKKILVFHDEEVRRKYLH